MADIELEVGSDGLAVLTLNAPHRRNALTPDMAAELVEACDAIDANTRIGAVVVRGAGSSFCAGADRAVLRSVAQDPAADEAFTGLTAVYNAFLRVGSLLPPTIAAVRGTAVGAGLNMALVTDLRVVAYDARLVSGFLPLGVHPGGGHFTLLSRLVGREAAAAMSVFGHGVDGRRAVELGLAWEAVADDEVENRACELAATAAASPELSRRTTRSFRFEADARGLSTDVASQFEHPVQMWSLRNGPLSK